MWLTKAMRAVKVMIKVLVPTVDFSCMPRKAVNTIRSSMPPPEPTKPVPKANGQAEKQGDRHTSGGGAPGHAMFCGGRVRPSGWPFTAGQGWTGERPA